MISLLHISDFHARGPGEQQPYLRRRVLGPAWVRNLEVLREQGEIDYVLFTGDGAQSGKAAEYGELTEFLGRTCALLNLTLDRVYPVPGNHDIDRALQSEAWARLRAGAKTVTAEQFSSWVAGLSDLKGFDNGWRDQMIERQQAYRDWVAGDLNKPELLASPHGWLGYRVALEQQGMVLQLIALDSAWLCGGDDDAGQIWLTRDQVYKLCCDARGNPLQGIRLAMMHHPFDELADGAACRKLLAEHVDLVLRGHLHRSELAEWRTPDTGLRHLAAGCLYEGFYKDQWPNACQRISLVPGNPAQAEVRFRVFAADADPGHWHDNNGLYAAAPQARLKFELGLPLGHPEPAAGMGFDPYQPALADRFVGRVEPLQRLTSAINCGTSVSLVGDWRIGKSSLLAAFYRQQAPLGRVLLLSGEGSESASVAQFVAAITGYRSVPDDFDGAADLLGGWAQRETKLGRRPLLLVDEFETMALRFDRRFFERLRGMLDRLQMVVSSRRPLDLLYEEANLTSPFHNRLEFLLLGLLADDEATALINHLGSGLPKANKELMGREAGAHPFYLNLLGKYLQANSPTKALDLFYLESWTRLRDLWRHLKPRDQNWLLGILKGKPCMNRELHARGLVTETGQPFGQVFLAFLEDQE